MRRQLPAFALAVAMVDVWSPASMDTVTAMALQHGWLKAETRHFEIHYLEADRASLERVIRSADRAYARISARLAFDLATKVPLVMFTPAGPLSREEVVTYATSDAVAPPQPHRSRLVLPLPDSDADLEALLLHELTHLLSYEIILPGTGGHGGLPRWVREGLARHMVGVWTDSDERLVRDFVASGKVPALSQLAGDGGFADARLNDVLGQLAFEYIERRWGPGSLRRFWDDLIVPRVDRTYDAVLELTPAEFDEAFRQYVHDRFQATRR